jgi:hypothetical protein
MKQHAKVTTNLKINETANRSNVLVVMSIENALGFSEETIKVMKTELVKVLKKTAKTLAENIANQIK